MVRLRETIRQLASVDVDVLIEGETGTGKELVARLLHRWSTRHARGFVAIDCAALPDAIADEVLFGNRIQRGRIADADRGTLFLDEIDSMSTSLQGKLLRVVEERELPSMTGEPRAVNLRVIAAAKGDLEGVVNAGHFRSDLFYRLETVRLRIPPLRERRKDIGLLFAYFLDEAANQFGQPRPDINATIESRLNADEWLGNVRELRNFAKQVVLGLSYDPTNEPSSLPLAEQMDQFEAKVLQDTLARLNGDVGEAAELLQLPRRSLYARLNRLGIDASSFRKKGPPEQTVEAECFTHSRASRHHNRYRRRRLPLPLQRRGRQSFPCSLHPFHRRSAGSSIGPTLFPTRFHSPHPVTARRSGTFHPRRVHSNITPAATISVGQITPSISGSIQRGASSVLGLALKPSTSSTMQTR